MGVNKTKMDTNMGGVSSQSNTQNISAGQNGKFFCGFLQIELFAHNTRHTTPTHAHTHTHYAYTHEPILHTCHVPCRRGRACNGGMASQPIVPAGQKPVARPERRPPPPHCPMTWLCRWRRRRSDRGRGRPEEWGQQ